MEEGFGIYLIGVPVPVGKLQEEAFRSPLPQDTELQEGVGFELFHHQGKVVEASFYVGVLYGNLDAGVVRLHGEGEFVLAEPHFFGPFS